MVLCCCLSENGYDSDSWLRGLRSNIQMRAAAWSARSRVLCCARVVPCGWPPRARRYYRRGIVFLVRVQQYYVVRTAFIIYYTEYFLLCYILSIY